MAKETVRPGVKDEIKTTVDDILEIELDNLRIKYGIKAKKKKRGKKKGKKHGKKKKKVPGATLAKDRDPNDLFNKLSRVLEFFVNWDSLSISSELLLMEIIII